MEFREEFFSLPSCANFSPSCVQASPLDLTRNESYGDWGSIFQGNVIASAVPDRLLHHSTAIDIKGESCRLKDKRKAGVLTKTAAARAS